jgi:hypothetical protein
MKYVFMQQGCELSVFISDNVVIINPHNIGK